ncbi:putative TrmH family RNA methyltransferase [Gregarina niphandrodes]|uniref:TrmH family RNA methyltransferase n=1 Tax=Gregarina niphandrodes TaxID=110365 RepID=A0A023B9I7_GRENI|nr:putative TrmH family RNA methyltransferase [Gregarina niphandrodes]EZG72987.1 putative TrmH family RNA methyltransferase [Gregarina niphandrodes]|eukprot:XP_011129682.1 putative TrmH family RNA methyltransferase [Gregarina niphandrodes]
MVQAYLILNNIGKRGNFGTLIRSAAAMGIQDIFVVGAEKLRTFGNQVCITARIDYTCWFRQKRFISVSQNTLSKCRLHYWNTLVELKEFLQSRDIKVVGIEIDDKSTALTETDFTNQDIAFMLGNEGTGMNAKQKQICDSFVYIEHFSGATASLNVAVAGGIVFHRYAIQNSKATQKRDGQKYVVQESVAEFEDLSQPNRGREYHRHDPADLSDLDLSFGGLERNED